MTQVQSSWIRANRRGSWEQEAARTWHNPLLWGWGAGGQLLATEGGLAEEDGMGGGLSKDQTGVLSGLLLSTRGRTSAGSPRRGS